MVLDPREVVLESDVAQKVHEVQGGTAQREEDPGEAIDNRDAVDVPRRRVCNLVEREERDLKISLTTSY